MRGGGLVRRGLERRDLLLVRGGGLPRGALGLVPERSNLVRVRGGGLVRRGLERRDLLLVRGGGLPRGAVGLGPERGDLLLVRGRLVRGGIVEPGNLLRVGGGGLARGLFVRGLERGEILFVLFRGFLGLGPERGNLLRVRGRGLLGGIRGSGPERGDLLLVRGGGFLGGAVGLGPKRDDPLLERGDLLRVRGRGLLGGAFGLGPERGDLLLVRGGGLLGGAFGLGAGGLARAEGLARLDDALDEGHARLADRIGRVGGLADRSAADEERRLAGEAPHDGRIVEIFAGEGPEDLDRPLRAKDEAVESELGNCGGRRPGRGVGRDEGLGLHLSRENAAAHLPGVERPGDVAVPGPGIPLPFVFLLPGGHA